MTSSHHPLRASSGDWRVDIIKISTNEKTLGLLTNITIVGDIVQRMFNVIFFIVIVSFG